MKLITETQLKYFFTCLFTSIHLVELKSSFSVTSHDMQLTNSEIFDIKLINWSINQISCLMACLRDLDNSDIVVKFSQRSQKCECFSPNEKFIIEFWETDLLMDAVFVFSGKYFKGKKT